MGPTGVHWSFVGDPMDYIEVQMGSNGVQMRRQGGPIILINLLDHIICIGHGDADKRQAG